MSNALEDAMARRERDAHAVYDAGSLAGPVRGRVRRARTMRGLGAAAAATVVVVVGAWGAVALGGAPRAAAPAASATPAPVASSYVDASPGLLTADDLLAGSAAATDADSLPALLCTASLPRECEEVSVPARGLFEVVPGSTRVEVSAAASEAVVEWELRHLGTDVVAVDAGWVLPHVALRRSSDYEDPANPLTGLRIELPKDATQLAPGDTLPGLMAVSTTADAPLLAGAPVQLDVLVPISFESPTETRELWLVLTSEPVTTTDADAPVATATIAGMLATAVTRHREDYDLGAQAQTALECPARAGAGLVECDAVVIATDAPMLILTDARFDVDDAAGTLTVNWTAQNVSGSRMMLDTGGTTVAIETAYSDTPPGESEAAASDRAGTLVAPTLWATETTRLALVRGASAVETIEPWQLFAGTATFELATVGDFAAGLTTVQVRVAPGDGEDASPVLILQMSWDG